MRRLHFDEQPDGTVTVTSNDEPAVVLPVKWDDLADLIAAPVASAVSAAPVTDVAEDPPDVSRETSVTDG